MTLKFQKMHANGDDFVVVDARGGVNFVTPEIARQLGDRNRGVGFNQLAVILDSEDCDGRLLFWNSDGTVLDTCGSATRGVADMLMRETGRQSCSLWTNRGLLRCESLPNGLVLVDMGKPLLNWRDVPLHATSIRSFCQSRASQLRAVWVIPIARFLSKTFPKWTWRQSGLKSKTTHYFPTRPMSILFRF